MNVPALRKLLSACDINKSSRLDYEDISFELNELTISLNKFDVGQVDGNFPETCNDESGDLNPRFAGETQRNAWEEFEETLDASYLGGYLVFCSLTFLLFICILFIFVIEGHKDVILKLRNHETDLFSIPC